MAEVNLVDAVEYDFVVDKLRTFFRQKGFVEVPVQHRLSILAACEDPRTIATYNYAGALWPLPQTGQMWLEYELLTKPDLPGYYCISTSYRNEPRPISGRHDLIFPMFEFETKGDLDTLQLLEMELLVFLGFSTPYAVKKYRDLASHYGVDYLTDKEESAIQQDFGSVCFITHFPQYTDPFWNMKKDGRDARKIDVILYGLETIGSAERSTNPDEMRELFHTVSGGMYADMLYSQFGRERVERELEEYLSLNFISRCGGGIGLTRMIKAFKQAKLL